MPRSMSRQVGARLGPTNQKPRLQVCGFRKFHSVYDVTLTRLSLRYVYVELETSIGLPSRI